MSSHKAKKHFGQHFLHDSRVIARIIQALNPQPGDALVEIGPGLGALTVPLIARVPALTVVELDRDVLAPLRAACGEHASKLTVIEADALSVDFGALAPAGGQLRLPGSQVGQPGAVRRGLQPGPVPQDGREHQRLPCRPPGVARHRR